jgi:hypothetical protein
MIDPRFAILGALIILTGNAAYARDTVRGNTQPNRVTWMLWALAPLIAFAAEVSQGVGLNSVLALTVGLGPLMVVVASFLDTKAYARVTPFDAACGVLSLVALGAWAATGRGNVAILLSILADFLAAVPTIHKAYRRPHTEHAAAFLSGVAGAAITLLTIKPEDWSFASVAFPAYILLDSALIASLILLPRPGRSAVARE